MPKLAKAVLTSQEELEQIDEKYRDLYVDNGNGMFILDVESIDDMPQIGGLKSALQKERDANKKLKRDLQETIDKYKDIDPEKARTAQKKLQELEDRQLLDAGKVDEVVAKRTERMQKNHQEQIQEFQKQISERDGELTRARSRLANLQVESAITTVLTSKAGKDLGVIPQAIPDIVRRALDVYRLEDKTGQIVPYRLDGSIMYGKDPAKPMPIDEWLSGLKPDCPHYFAPSGGAGGGNDSGAGIPRKKRSEMTDDEKAQFIGKFGQDAYLNLPQ